MKRFASVALCLVALVSSAEAKKKSDALPEAKRLAKSGKYVEAVDLCASELATAQKKKDLRRELEIADVLKDDAFQKLMIDVSNAKTYGLCLKALLLKLDPKKTSGICSAGHVAHALLHHATRTGDMTHVSAAVPVCSAYAKQKTGTHGKLMVVYAEALKLVAAGKPGEACRPLAAALATARSHGWSWTGVHLATELAAAHLAAGAEQEAVQAIAGGQAALQYTKDRAVFQAWRTMIGVRLPEAPASVLAPYEAVAEWFHAGATGAPGGRGGNEASRTKVAAAWKKLSKSKPFVRIERTGTGYRMTESFDKRFAQEKKYETGVRHMDDGGITLGFFDYGVRLTMLDFVGNRSQPGGSSEPGPFQFFTPITAEETWGLTKSGAVIVK